MPSLYGLLTFENTSKCWKLFKYGQLSWLTALVIRLIQIIWKRPKDGTHGVQANYFYFRIAKSWNDLPSKVVEAATIDTFKIRLDEAWVNHPNKYTIDKQNDKDQFVEAL